MITLQQHQRDLCSSQVRQTVRLILFHSALSLSLTLNVARQVDTDTVCESIAAL